MDENVRDDRMSVYEIGFLLAGLPDEKIEAEASKIKEIITKNGGEIIADEAPHHENLAYTIRKKMVSGAYEKHDEAHFGWVKFSNQTNKIDAIKKAVEVIPSVLRVLIITTVRENTYLGKRASQIAAALSKKTTSTVEVDAVAAPVKDVVISAPATIEEMDKSIDEMVKEV